MINKWKFSRRENKKTHFKPFCWTFLVGVMVLLMGISCVSAFDWTDGIDAYYEMDGANPTSELQYDLTNNGASSGATGKINNAFDFERSQSDYMNNDSHIIPDDNGTINVWVKWESTANDQYVYLWTDTFGNGYAGVSLVLDGTGLYFHIDNSDLYDTNWIPNTGTWYMFTQVWNETHHSFYIDGTLNGTKTWNSAFNNSDGYSYNRTYFGRNAGGNYFDGLIDEVGTWNKTLSSADVTELYNAGGGLPYGGATSQTSTITLISPEGGSSISDIGTDFVFQGNLTDAKHNWTNATYYVWYENGTEFNSTTVPFLGMNNDSSLYIDGFALGNYIWNVKGVYANASYDNFTWATNNNTLLVGASVISEDYETVVYETSRQGFYANISLISGTNLYLTELIYNGTSYPATTTERLGGYFDLNASIDIPLVPIIAQNHTWFWKLTYKTDSSFVFQNVTSHSQKVVQIRLGDCAGDLSTVSLNFTAYNERDLSRLGGFNFDATFFYWLGSGAVYKNASFDNSSQYEKNICILPDNVTYYLVNSDIEYTSNVTGFTTRNYYFENHTIDNRTQNVSLFLLNSTFSTSFILEVLNQNQQEVAGALVYAERYYPGNGKYEVVQIARTDEQGKSVGFFETETVDYRFRVVRDTITELLTEKQKVVPETTPYTLSFTIGESWTRPWADFDQLDNLIYTLEFDKSTNTTEFTYIDNSDDFTSALLVVKKINFNGSATIICNSSSTQTSNTLSCDLTGETGLFEAIGYIKRGTQEYKVVEILVIQFPTSSDIFGSTGVIIAWLIILTAGFAMIWHPIAGIVSVESAIIFTNLIGLASFSPLFVWGSLGVSIILIYVLKD